MLFFDFQKQVYSFGLIASQKLLYGFPMRLG
jgi:hypothetical protein